MLSNSRVDSKVVEEYKTNVASVKYLGISAS